MKNNYQECMVRDETWTRELSFSMSFGLPQRNQEHEWWQSERLNDRKGNCPSLGLKDGDKDKDKWQGLP